METKLTFAKGWCKFWSFIAQIFQDKADGTSHKRIIVLGAFIMFCRVINAGLNNQKLADDNLLYALVIIILGGIGMSIPEWFSPKAKNPT